MENLHIMGCWPSRIINQRRGLFPAAFDSFTLLWVNVRKRLERAEAWHQNDEEKQIDVADSALPLSFFFFTCGSGLSRTTSEELERRQSRCDDSTSWPHQLQRTSIRAKSAHSIGSSGGSRRAHTSQSLPRKGDEDKQCASCRRLHVDARGGGGGGGLSIPHVQALKNERVAFPRRRAEVIPRGQRGADGERELPPGCPPPPSSHWR